MFDSKLRKQIGARAKQRRLELNLPMQYVADQLGVNKSTVQRYESGAWTTFKEEAEGASGGKTCTVKPDDVQATCAFRCRARLDASSDVYYYDTITIIDKTDNYQADIDSTAGDVFKNTIGETCLICRLWQAGAEVDPLKCTTFSETAPSSPTGGTYYYKIVLY